MIICCQIDISLLYNNLLLKYCQEKKVEARVFEVGLRQNDVFSDEGVLGDARDEIETQLTFLT